MIKFAQFTVYEGLGYFFPGAVLLAALATIAWAVWAPYVPLPIFSPPFELWLLLAFVSYYAGHAVQGLGNVLLDNNSFMQTKVFKPAMQWFRKLPPIQWSRRLLGLGANDSEGFPEDIGKAAKAKAQMILKAGTANLDFKWVQMLADEAIIQRGVSAERDMYIYRQGFYRGSSLSLFVFGLGVWVRAARGVTSVNFWARNHQVYSSELILLGALGIVASSIFLRRFNRFGRYHRIESILGFLILDSEDKPKAKNRGED